MPGPSYDGRLMYPTALQNCDRTRALTSEKAGSVDECFRRVSQRSSCARLGKLMHVLPKSAEMSLGAAGRSACATSSVIVRPVSLQSRDRIRAFASEEAGSVVGGCRRLSERASWALVFHAVTSANSVGQAFSLRWASARLEAPCIDARGIRQDSQRPAEAGRKLNACPTNSPGQAEACPTAEAWLTKERRARLW